MPLWMPMILRFADRLFNLFLHEPDIFDHRMEYMHGVFSSMFSSSKEELHGLGSSLLTFAIVLFSTYFTFKILRGMLGLMLKYMFLLVFMVLVAFYLDWHKVHASLAWLSACAWPSPAQSRGWISTLLEQIKEADPIELAKQVLGL